jgi:hypothetical protein
MKKPVYKRGFNEIRKEQERREKAKELRKGKLWRFMLKEGEEDVPVRFLTEQPFTFYEHTIKEGGNFLNVPCIGEDCPYCEGKKPQFVGAWLVVDMREFEVKERDDNGNETGKKKKIKDRIKLLVRGVKTAGTLDRLSRKYGLMDKIWDVSRTGKGTDTVWNFEVRQEDELTEKQLNALLAQLPEEYRDADPYDIVQDQLEKDFNLVMQEVNGESSGDEGDDGEVDADSVKSKLQPVEDDGEEEEKPQKKSLKPKAKKHLKRM